MAEKLCRGCGSLTRQFCVLTGMCAESNSDLHFPSPQAVPTAGFHGETVLFDEPAKDAKHLNGKGMTQKESQMKMGRRKSLQEKK